ncbi:Protein CBG16200 [Caenorhabditis briggsae]|uniref:Protein CBG16200 n=1 Tax=Caenorhabditis briggsae TaxID=6238 RepID=A8XNW5_CAEBR|nr:Protein CBG16200 [Caenorhabditis briggsae]CAP34205.2 Protein CBG16200 [Caenorhabditis briggsae]
MKPLLTIILVFLYLISNLALATSPLFPFLGPCQKRCITQFGEIKERTTNTDTVYREIDVFNKTEFSLVSMMFMGVCKLGCNSPEYTELNLPAFRFGQSAYQAISSDREDKPTRGSVVKDVHILCLDNVPYITKNSSSSTGKRVLTGTILLALDDGVSEIANIYFVEVVARDADDEDTYIVYQDWCYSSSCNFTFNTPIETSSGLEVRLRVSTFDDNGSVGGLVLSRWYNINHILASTSVDMKLKSIAWKDDKAAARFSFDQEGSVHIPSCSLQIMYKNALSAEFKLLPFHLDRTREIIIKKLDFNQTYTMRLVPYASESNRPSSALATTKFQVPACSDMVNDMSMCAPPPVLSLTPHWNLSSSNGYGLVMEWTYFSDGMANLTIPMSHFMFFVHPLITSNNEKCGKYEPIRRDVTYTHRKVVFYVPDAECNYEVEVSAFDTKQRTSEVKKIKILRVNEPSYMSFLLSNDISTSVGLGALLVSSIVVLILIVIFFVHKKRKDTKKMDDESYGTGERMVYAYVDATDASKTVIGVRPLNFRLEPVENINRNIEAALAQRTYGYNLHSGTRRAMCQVITNSESLTFFYLLLLFQNELYPYYQPQNQLRREPRIPRSTMELSRNDHTYATILDFRSETDMSDEVFEIRFQESSLSNHSGESPSVCALPPIAPYEYFDSFTAYPLQDFRIRQPNEPFGSQYWIMNTAMDSVRGHCFSLKIAKDYSEQTMQAMRKELEFLKTLPAHPNCVGSEGVVLSRWENNQYQVVGMLMECCRGGSLHNYIISVGSVLRRHVIGTPETTGRQSNNDDLPLRSYNESPNPSSGYDSFSSKDRKTPETGNEIIHHYGRVSIRFSQFAEQIASALEHLHRSGIVHTRVTTISIYLLRDYTDPLDMLCDQMVKLGDFGNSARNADDVIVDQILQPPEVALGKKYEAKGDIWQFGTCLAEMCSLGVPYQAQKQIPLSGLDEFDKLPSTCVLQDATKRCLNPRNRPSASDLRGLFQTDTARDIKALDMATMDQMKQSLLI